MQTFLPEPDFQLTATILDSKRLFKQVVEARQILVLLGEKIHKTKEGSILEEFLQTSMRHKNHPVLKMWHKHIDFLKLYHDFMLLECQSLGIKTALYYLADKGYAYFTQEKLPKWFGNKEFHDSHKSNLVRKFPAHYRKYYPDIEDNLPYIWPEE